MIHKKNTKPRAIFERPTYGTHPPIYVQDQWVDLWSEQEIDRSPQNLRRFHQANTTRRQARPSHHLRAIQLPLLMKGWSSEVLVVAHFAEVTEVPMVYMLAKWIEQIPAIASNLYNVHKPACAQRQSEHACTPKFSRRPSTPHHYCLQI